jgi:hypothetical protein
MVNAQGEALILIVLTLVMSNKVLVGGYYLKELFPHPIII